MAETIIYSDDVTDQEVKDAQQAVFDNQDPNNPIYNSPDDVKFDDVMAFIEWDKKETRDEVMGVMENLFKRHNCILIGSSQRWDSSHEVYAYLTSMNNFLSLFEGWNGYLTFTNVDGELQVSCRHHDGTNTYIIRVLTEAGQQYYDDWELGEGVFSDNQDGYYATTPESEICRKIFDDNILSSNIDLPSLVSEEQNESLKEKYNGNNYYTLANIEDFINDICDLTIETAKKKNVLDILDTDLPQAEIEEKVSRDVSNIVNDLLTQAIDKDHCVAGEIYATDKFYDCFLTPLFQKLDVELTKMQSDLNGAEA